MLAKHYRRVGEQALRGVYAATDVPFPGTVPWVPDGVRQCMTMGNRAILRTSSPSEEKGRILEAYYGNRGNITKTADLLQMSRRLLKARLAEYAAEGAW